MPVMSGLLKEESHFRVNRRVASFNLEFNL